MLSASVIRVASYNMEADIDGVTTPRSGFYQVLEGIGEEQVQGNVRPIDILGLEETTSNSTTIAPIVTALNSYYNGSAVYAQSTYQATEDGGDNADGNGPNALIYNTSTLNLLASVGVGTPEGSGNGEYRQVVRYEFQPVGDTGNTGIFYVYVSHMKSLSSGNDQTDEGYQLEEAKIILENEATLPTNSSVLYTGDLNSDNSDTAIPYMESSVAGEAYDPLGGAYSSKIDESDSSTSLEYRDDYELMTAPVYQDTGTLNYISGSYHAFGNNGSVSDPASSSNTALNSDLVQDGGTFISASTLYGDLGSASDHLPVVADYTLGTATTTGTPSVGSLSASPTTVGVGASVTLSASNVTETGSPGSITGVNFYRESNGQSGLQIGSDTLIGAGTQSGTTWTINTSTSGLGTAGTYTYYAVATDSNGNTSPAATTTVTVQGVPSINSLSVSPTTVTTGATVSLTANTVTDSGSTVRSVAFYLESNGTSGLQTGTGGDTLVGYGTQSGITWTLSNVSTTGLEGGTYTYYAVASDNSGASSSPVSTTLTVYGVPTIGSFTISPASVVVGTSTTLTASNVTESGGTISSVNFYLETNGQSGLQIGSDTLVGVGTQSGTTWTLSTSTSGLAAGTYTYYAVATDTAGATSPVASTTLTVTAGPPTIGSLSVSSTSAVEGATVSLTSSNVTEAGGAISSVAFYLESNGTSGLQIGSDTFLGDGTQSGTTWTLSSVSTVDMPPGSYVYYAVATDASGVSSNVALTTLTVMPPSPLADITILASASPNGPFTNNLNVTAGETVYLEVQGQLAPVGTSNDADNPYTITSETAHPGVGTSGYDGIQSVSFDLSDSGGVAVAFASAALSTNPSSGDDWSAGLGASAGIASGASLTGVAALLPPGVFGGATSPESILTGSFVLPADASVGATSTIEGNIPSDGFGGLAINSNPSTGTDATLIGTQGDPYGYFGFAPLVVTVAPALPSWLSDPGGNDTWVGGTLTVNDPSTIIADPGSAEPNIVDSGEPLAITPSVSDQDIHVGGITLSNGASLTMTSLGSARTHSNHNVLVVGTKTASSSNPTFSVDSTSKLDLADNDLIIHTGETLALGQAELSAVQALAYGTGGGRNGGHWTGNELTSSAAAARRTADRRETTQLAVVLNNDLQSRYSSWTVGSAVESLNRYDIIVKYTYTGDFALQGDVTAVDSSILGLHYNTTGEWADGDTNDDGSINVSDSTNLGLDFNLGTSAYTGAAADQVQL